MQTFTGREYLKIDIANCFGLDRLDWDERLHWFANNEPVLEQMDVLAESPVLFRKAVRAWRTVQAGKPTNHSMGLDATASGLQIMGCLSGCHNTARAVNLINTGHREDVYQSTSEHMNQAGEIQTTRKQCKKPIMTVFYGSTQQPRQIFGEGLTLSIFYQVLEQDLTGAFELMGIIQSHWQKNVEFHQWTLPDGHVARVPVTETIEKSLEIDEADHMRFAYRAKVIKPQRHSRSLAANIVHSIDGFVVRCMVASAKEHGYWMAPIHDCFYASPNHMNEVRAAYLRILQWIAQQNLVADILSQIAGRPINYRKHSHNLHVAMQDAEYHLS